MSAGRSAVGTRPGIARALVWLGRASVLGALLLIAVTTRLFTRWPSVYLMTGPSMEPTVLAGEYFLAATPPRLERGRLVLFRFEDEDGVFHVLRRLAALPGDTLEMREGRAVVNGAPQEWPFRVARPLAGRSYLARTADLFTWGPLVVPPDSVALLSDTRDMVGWPDTRFIGFVSAGALLAEARRVVWSPERGRILKRLQP